MTILIDLSVAGINTGPFNLYSDADGYTSAFATNITRQQLLDGYPATVPNGTTNIKFQSLSNVCPNDTILPVISITTTTTTTAIPTCISDGWSTTNLNVSAYRNGDTIPHATTDADWIDKGANEIGAWCYYNNDPANEATYGKLYNMYAVKDTLHGGLAPSGYHIPSDAEWTTLINCLGGSSVAGGKMKSTGTIQGNDGLWESPNTDATNSSGFTGLPGGYRDGVYGVFYSINRNGVWWSSLEINDRWGRTVEHDSALAAVFASSNMSYGFSVRIKQD